MLTDIRLRAMCGYSAAAKTKDIWHLALRHRGESGVVYCRDEAAMQALDESLRARNVATAQLDNGIRWALAITTRKQWSRSHIPTPDVCSCPPTFIVHYTLPPSPEAYIADLQRYGQPQEAVIYHNLRDIITLRLAASGQEALAGLWKMQAYAESPKCRRRALQEALGLSEGDDCGICDNCRTRPMPPDGDDFQTMRRRSGYRQPVMRAAIGEDTELFAKLRSLRSKIAEANNWPLYVVLSDKTLHELAAAQPTTIEAFAQIHGIGKVKRDAYGPEFIALIAEHTAENKKI